MSGFELRDMTEVDGRAVLSIYQEGMDTGQATFQQTAPAWMDFDQRHLARPRLVAVDADDGNVLGWAAGSPVSARPVYRGVVEESIYIGSAAWGRGVGRALLNAYVAATEAADIWTLQAGIFPENPASLALHQGCGFEIIGTRQKIGKMGHGPMVGQWRDVIWLERRSRTVGAG